VSLALLFASQFLGFLLLGLACEATGSLGVSQLLQIKQFLLSLKLLPFS
jgi:hypothetical protein